MRFRALDTALELVRSLRPLLRVIRRYDAKHANHIRDAASSAAMCLAEGNGRQGRDRMHLWRIALGSAEEVHMGLLVAVAWGYSEEPAVAEALDVADHLIRTIEKLVR